MSYLVTKPRDDRARERARRVGRIYEASTEMVVGRPAAPAAARP